MKRILAALALASMTTAAVAADLGGPAYAGGGDVPAAKNPWGGIYVEGGAGLTASTLDLSEGGDSVSLGDNSYTGHVGVGWDFAAPNSHLVLGVLARYELSDVGFKAFGETLADAQHSWMLGARAGYAPGPWMIYALAGYRWSKLEPNAELEVGDINTSSVVLGGGIEVLLGNHVFAGLEYTAALEAGESVDDLNVDATEHTGKARIGWKF